MSNYKDILTLVAQTNSMVRATIFYSRSEGRSKSSWYNEYLQCEFERDILHLSSIEELHETTHLSFTVLF